MIDNDYKIWAAYQIISQCFDKLGLFETDEGIKILDYFADYGDAEDPLPFNLEVLLEKYKGTNQ